MAIPSRWLITEHDTKWAGYKLKITVQTDVDCHLTMRYQQHGIEPHFRTKMVRGVPQTRDPHLAFDNYLEMDEIHAGDHKTHRFSLVFPYVCKTYYWKFVGTIAGVFSPSHSPVFSEHLKEVAPVTKEIYFDVMTGLPYQNMADIGNIPVMRCLASSHYARIAFMVPHDFAELELAELIVIPRCSVPGAQWWLYTQFAAEGERYDTHAHHDTTTTYDTTGKNDEIFKVDVTALFADIAVGDFGGLELKQNHADHDVYVMGLRFKYE